MNLREKAFVLALKPETIHKYCSKCVKSEVEGKLSRCASCKFLHYCSTNCQKIDWQLHKAECSSIKSSKDIGHESYRFILRLHHKSKNEVHEATEDTTKRTFATLIWYPTITQRENYKTWKTGFRKFTTTNIADERLAELYGKMVTNVFGLTNQYTIEIGLALYIQLSAIDHSCKPRTRIAFLGDEAIMIPTSGDLSSELTIEKAQHSYINELMPRSRRRENLKNRYDFDCNCDGCRDDTRERNMTGYECENCANCVEMGGVCKVCNFKMSPDQIDLCMLNKEMADATVNALIKSSDSGKHETRLQICKKSLEVMDGVLYKNNVHRYIMLRQAFASAMALNELTDAANYGNELLNVQKFYQSSNDLALISTKLSLAKLFLRMNNKKNAHALLNEIQQILEKVYGANSLVFREVQSLILLCK